MSNNKLGSLSNKLLTRRILIISLFISSAVVLSGPLFFVISNVPNTIQTMVADASVFFETDDSTVLTGNQCTTLVWRAEGIRAIEVDGIPVIGEGTKRSCERDASLLVTFVDGTKREFVLTKSVLFDNRLNRLLFVAAIASLGCAFFLTALPAKVIFFFHVLIPGAVLARLNAQQNQHSVTRHWLTLTIIILWAVGLRATYLSQPLRYDESWTYQDFVSQPLSVGLSSYYTTNNHIFHTFLAHITTSIFGGLPWALRLPAFFAGILVVPAAYALGRRYFGSSAALLAAAFAAGSLHLIEYSVNARGYTLISLALLLLLLVADFWVERRTRRLSIGFVVLTALGLYTVPTFIYGLVPVTGWMFAMILWRLREKQKWLALRKLIVMLTFAGILTALLYTPPALNLISLGSTNDQMAHMEARSIGDVLSSGVSVAQLAWERWNLDMPLWLSLALLAGFCVSILFQGIWGRLRLSPFLIALVILPPVLFLLANANYVRLWVFYLPVYLVLATGGIGCLVQLALPHLRQQRIFVSLSSLVVTIVLGVNVLSGDSVYTGVETGLMNYAEDAVLIAKQSASDGDIIICDGFCEAVRIYGAIHGVEITPYRPTYVLPGQKLFLIMSSFQADLDPSEGGWSLQMSLDYVMSEAYDNLNIRSLFAAETAEVYEITEKIS